ncbi:Putrescine importer PuuP [Entomobacter blattae]|uniref:Putrescine importer PuuP n=1 Tax=Entomobacter blattae TaxID=2762277 RepID=A0A7H1NQN4_9PROT|nr:Putrescine importer PuuP [Entomobacter blattae]
MLAKIQSVNTSGSLGKKERRPLTVFSLVTIGVACLTPLTVFDTFGIISRITHGHVPLAYLLATACILLTAISYGQMARLFPHAGSAYGYVSQVCGSRIGFFVGWATLLDYIMLPLINVLLESIYLHALFPALSQWIWIIGMAFLITLINMFPIGYLTKISFLLAYTPLVFMALFILLVMQKTGQTHTLWTIAPLWNGSFSLLPVIGGAAVVVFSFLGFDALTTMTSEVGNPARDIPRAIVITVCVGGAIFFCASWFIQLYYPDNSQFKHPTQAMPEIVLYVGGRLFQSFFLCGIFFNCIASSIASHAATARLVYIMSQDHIFPIRPLSYLHPRYKTPMWCVGLVGISSLGGMFFSLDVAVSLISFGALVAFTAVNFSVLMRMGIERKGKKGKIWVYTALFPLLGIVSLLFLWSNIERNAFILGLVWSGIGCVWMAALWCWARFLPSR